MPWNERPTPEEVTALVVNGKVLGTRNVGDYGFEIEYQDGRILTVSPVDGAVYSSHSVDYATIKYSIFTPKEPAWTPGKTPDRDAGPLTMERLGKAADFPGPDERYVHVVNPPPKKLRGVGPEGKK